MAVATWPDQWAEATTGFILLRLASTTSSVAEVMRRYASSGLALDGGGGVVLGYLTRLEDDGLIQFDDPTTIQLTAEGRNVLNSWETRWVQFGALMEATRP